MEMNHQAVYWQLNKYKLLKEYPVSGALSIGHYNNDYSSQGFITRRYDQLSVFPFLRVFWFH
jgi:hypothetical protein